MCTDGKHLLLLVALPHDSIRSLRAFAKALNGEKQPMERHAVPHTHFLAHNHAPEIFVALESNINQLGKMSANPGMKGKRARMRNVQIMSR